MTSPKKTEAARVNGLKSCGPRTLDGKARSSRNAMKLGLSLPISLAPSDHHLCANLIDLFDGDGDDLEITSAAQMAAQAQTNLQMVRQAKRIAIRQVSEKFEHPLAFKKAIQLAASCERYEGRAFSKWKKAVRRLSEAHLKLTERTKVMCAG